MLSTTNGRCGIDRTLPAEWLDIQPFQGWGTGTPPTQGGASLTLGFKIEPLWGSRSEPCRNAEMNDGRISMAMQGTPTPFQPSAMTVSVLPSSNIPRWLKGRP